MFHEITKKALEEAIAHPRILDMNLVNAQQSRRVLDRLVGFQVSPVLWKKIRRGLSAGRVQSVAVRLIVEREREIKAFVPEESWKLSVSFAKDNIAFSADFHKLSSKVKKLKNQEDLLKFLSTLGVAIDTLEQKTDKRGNKTYAIPFTNDFILAKSETKESKRYPGAPFTTSTLQQEASRKLGFSVSQTMTVAQNLYQNGHITYMRTDSVNLSTFAMDACRSYIEKEFGKEYSLPDGRKYTNKQANAQEAHEAIRPTAIDKSPENIGLAGNDVRLYKLIWERTVASQMKEAIVEGTTYTFSPVRFTDQEWIAKGEVILFAGFMKLYVEGTDDEEEAGETSRLPEIKEKAILESNSLSGVQSFTRPPARYTEAMLVKKLESE